MAEFNVLRNAVIRNSMSCRHDTNEGFSVVWDEDENFRLYEEFSGLTTRLVWDRNYFAVATSGVCYVGPITDQPAFDGGVYDLVKVTYRVEVGFNQDAPTTGKVQFQTVDDPVYDDDKSVEFTIDPDNAYNEYTIDMSQLTLWQGDITRLRLYPFVDGGIGNILHLKSLRVVSSTNFACDTNFNTPICDHFSLFVHPCPWVGAGGSCQGSSVGDGIDILEGVNDKIIVNINGYGEQAVTLRPVRGARLRDVARDLEERLSNVGIGGYAGNRVDVDLDKLVIVADDTREASSTVAVLDSPAARTLGFYDSEGVSTSTCTGGVQAASRFEPAGSIQLSRGEIANFYVADPGNNKSYLALDPRNYAVQAGRPDYNEASNDTKIDFTGDTIIDFNHPFTNNGVITRVVYAGDVRTNTKFVFFHPKADGTLEQYASIPVEAGLGNLADKVIEKTTDIRVRKGDLLGIYDAKINLGSVEEKPNVSYFRYEGETEDGDILPLVDTSGRGEKGLFLFAHGTDKQTAAVLDMEFENPQLLEEIRVRAEEEARTEEIKLTRALVGGINGGPFITGITGEDKNGSQAPTWVELGALTDGITEPVPNVDVAQPAWVGTNYTPADLYDQTELALEMDFAKGIPVLFNINRTRLFFVSPNNIKYFRVEYPITTNEFDTDRHWGPTSSRYNNVFLDGQPLEPTDHPLYTNPLHATAEEFVNSYQVLEYRILDLHFESVKARSLRYSVRNYDFEDDETKQTLSNFTLAPNPSILEWEVYAESVPVANISDNFFFESSQDGEEYFLQQTVRDEGTSSARYLIGWPIKFLRAHILPQGPLNVFSFETLLSRSETKIKSNTPDRFVNMNIPQGDYTSAETITVTNEGEEPFNYFVDISPQKNPIERCILWNKLGTPEETAKSELGPSPSFSKRDEYFPREYNYAYLAPGYMAEQFWMLNTPVRAYLSYDDGATWEPRGSLVSDYNAETYLDTNVDSDDGISFVYLLIDLGSVYDIETVQQKVASGFSSWTGPLYSSKDVDDPSQLNVFTDFFGSKEGARWLRFRDPATPPGSPNNDISRMTYMQLSLDPTKQLNKGKVEWISAPLMTNQEFGLLNVGSCGDGWNCSDTGFARYYALDLEDQYRITSVFTGPLLGDGISTSVDFDFVSGGGIVGASDIAYSSSNTDDPKKVIWGSFGGSPGVRSRWILFRKLDGGIIDEVVVRVEDNSNSLKPVFANERWWTAQLGTVYRDRVNYQEGFHSIAIDYAAGLGPAEEEIELVQSLGIDHQLAKRDQLRILLYISDITQLDTTQGHIALGPNTDEDNSGNNSLLGATPDRINYFQWNISEMADAGLLSTGWNELFLPFTDNFREGQPYFTRDNQSAQAPSAASGHNRFRWIRLNFAGKEGNAPITLNLDGAKIVRGDFLPSKFGTGLYLANHEYAKFPLTNVNTFQGTIEFYMTSDWTKSPGCFACEDPRDHTIFRLFNSDRFSIQLLMTGEGMELYLTDNVKHYTLTDNDSALSIFIDVPTHIAVTWDILGERSEKALAFWVNGQLSSSLSVENLVSEGWAPNSDAVLLFGAQAWDGLVTPYASGANAIIDNIKVYNYAKSDFSFSVENEELEQFRPADELIELSSDGVNFYGSETRGTDLPLLYRDIPPGGTFKVYVRNKDAEGVASKDGQSRTSYVEVIKARSDAV